MRWVLRLALAVGALLGLLALVLGVLVAAFDAEHATQVAVDWMRTHHRRTLAVEGPVALAVFPRLAVTAKGLRLSEAGRPDEFLRADEVALALRAWPLLRGQVAVDHVQARGVLAAWHRDAQGASNIDDFIRGSPAGSAPAGPATAPGAVPAFEVRALRKAECAVRGCEAVHDWHSTDHDPHNTRHQRDVVLLTPWQGARFQREQDVRRDGGAGRMCAQGSTGRFFA
jgi:AsmA protein